MRIGIIGLGARSTVYVTNLKLPSFSSHCITAICDKDEVRLKNYCSYFFADQSNAPKTFTNYKEMLTSGLVDAVIICTPDFEHKDIAIAAMDAHLHILLEKPIEVTFPRITELFEHGKDYRKTLMMGFELRYTHFYKSIRSIVTSQRLGDIISVQACERLSSWHAASFQRRWHRFIHNSGGMMNTKCCHDMDILRYIIGSEVDTVVAFGDRRVFLPKKDAPITCIDCPSEKGCPYKFDYTDYNAPYNFQCIQNLCPYNSGSELVDNEMMLLKYKNGVTANFELCLVSGEATRQIIISGTKAELRADLAKNTIWITPLDGETEEIKLSNENDGHGGGDLPLLNEFINSIENGLNHNNIVDGVIASRTALAGEVSMQEHRIVSMNELN